MQKNKLCFFLSVGEKQYKFEEILPIYKAVNSETDVGTFADFMEAFKTFDREGQGFIAAAELRHVLTSLGNTQANSASYPRGMDDIISSSLTDVRSSMLRVS